MNFGIWIFDMWVILCTAVWLSFNSDVEANLDFNSHLEVASQMECYSPKLATDAQLEIYKSKQDPRIRINSLSDLVSLEKQNSAIAEWEENKQALATPTPSPSPEPDQGEPIATYPHCVYWWTRPNPNEVTLNQRCSK